MISTLAICLVVLFLSLWKSEVGLAISIQTYLISSAFDQPNVFDQAPIADGNDLSSALAPMIAFSIILLRSVNKNRKFSLRFMDVGFIVLGWILVVGSLYSPLQNAAIMISAKYFTLGIGFYIVARVGLSNHPNLQNAIKNVVMSTWVVSLVLGIYAIVQFWGVDYKRLTIGSAHPIPFSLLISIGVLINFFWLLQKSNTMLKLGQVASFIVLLYILINTNTRGTLISVSVAIVYLLIVAIRYQRGLGKAILVIPILVLGVFAVGAYNPEMMRKVQDNVELLTSDDKGASISERQIAWQDALEMTSNNPFLGVGTGGFAAHSKLGYPHNVFLERFSENGVIGGMVLVVVFMMVSFLILKVTQTQNPIAYIISAIVLLNMVEMQFSFTLWMHKLFYLFCGILAVIYYRNRWGEGARINYGKSVTPY
ncbi:O-antigen ligase family protein [Paenibacillus spongiae]|uniref:O-antigen ligase family protein n=1 Tax=Paenibacillus spongiae TaxID=2909671 RepID=A0ABY5SDK5_9BACL|nr:O-antigen ligase family protein [Paenibacillus spongiae]UVI31610.1 O-antigen ligase family protein [Paenibacillus spongiae]